MIIADLNVICIEQKACCPFAENNKIVFEAQDRNNDHSKVYPLYGFNEAYKLKGWWYTYWPNEHFFLEKPFFNLAPRCGDDMICLRDEWKDTVEHLLRFFILSSPICSIGILIRVQDKIYRDVCYIDSLGRFLNLLTGGIRYNTLYIVEDNGIETE